MANNIDVSRLTSVQQNVNNAVTVFKESAKIVASLRADVRNGRMPSDTTLESLEATMKDRAEKVEKALKVLGDFIEDHDSFGLDLPPL